jgi:hypothetical protein
MFSKLIPITIKIFKSNSFCKLSKASFGRVTLEVAKLLPKNYDEMPNDVLLSMAVMGDQEAREERLIREIMSVDNISWYFFIFSF